MERPLNVSWLITAGWTLPNGRGSDGLYHLRNRLESEDGGHTHAETGKDISAIEFFLRGKDFDVLQGPIHCYLLNGRINNPHQANTGGQVFVNFSQYFTGCILRRKDLDG